MVDRPGATPERAPSSPNPVPSAPPAGPPAGPAAGQGGAGRLWDILLDPIDLHSVGVLVKTLIFSQVAGLGSSYERGDLMSVGVALVFFAPLRLLPARWQGRAAFLWNLTLSLLVLGDRVYARYFGDVLSMALLDSLGNLPGVDDSITALLRPVDAVWFIDALVLGLLLRGRPRQGPRSTAPSSPRWRFAPGLVIGVLSVVGGVYWHFHDAQQGVFLRVWSQPKFVRSAGLLTFHTTDVLRWGYEHLSPPSLSEADEAEIQAHWAAVDAAAPHPGDPLYGVAKGANVIFLMVEALQQEAIDAEIDGALVAPHLRALAAESITLRPFYHQAAQGRTADAELLTLCGLLPLEQGAALFRRPLFPQQCLPEVLRDEAGYTTASYHALEGGFWNRAAVAPRIGIDKFFQRKNYKRTAKPIGMGMADRPFLDQTAAKLQKLKEPYFAHVITLTSHHPFDIPKSESKLKLGALKGSYTGKYYQAVNYTDRAIGAFVGYLRATGMLDRSVLVVYGDHDMGRLDTWGQVIHRVGNTSESIQTRVSWLHQVPLLIRLPGGAAAGERPGPAAQAQLPATALHLLGIEGRGRDFLAPSALVEPSALVPFRDGSAIEGDVYAGRPEEADSECYQIQSGARADAARCAALNEASMRAMRVSDQVLFHGLTRRPAPDRPTPDRPTPVRP